jgi:hypothetical protein
MPTCEYQKAGITQSVLFGYGLDNWGIMVWQFVGAGYFSLSKTSRPSLGPTHSPSPWVPGALSWWVNWSGLETGHSSESVAEVKNKWALHLRHPICPYGTHRHNFTWPLLYIQRSCTECLFIKFVYGHGISISTESETR